MCHGYSFDKYYQLVDISLTLFFNNFKRYFNNIISFSNITINFILTSAGQKKFLKPKSKRNKYKFKKIMIEISGNNYN